MAAPERPVVCNTTPLINLVGVGLLDLLPRLYSTIWVPEAVNREYTAGMRAGDPILEDLPWIRIVTSVAVDMTLPPSLGTGEVEVISLAIAENAHTVLIDEQLARSIARKQVLP